MSVLWFREWLFWCCRCVQHCKGTTFFIQSKFSGDFFEVGLVGAVGPVGLVGPVGAPTRPTRPTGPTSPTIPTRLTGPTRTIHPVLCRLLSLKMLVFFSSGIAKKLVTLRSDSAHARGRPCTTILNIQNYFIFRLL